MNRSATTDSSPEASGSSYAPSMKKRRLPGACDICKRKKVRCDSGQRSGNRCTNCINGGFECTHVELSKSLGPAKGYVENLEQRLEKMEKLLARLVPNVDIDHELEEEPIVKYETPDSPIPRNDDEDAIDLAVKMQKLELAPSERRYIGKSSGLYLVQTAISKRYDEEGHRVLKPKGVHIEFSDLRHYQMHRVQRKTPQYSFPPNDLILPLFALYFEHINTFLPLLHRPTMAKGVLDGLHLQDHMFGGVVLLVCALGARFSDDPRVLLDGEDVLSAGWKYFDQVTVIRPYMTFRASLYEVQMISLSVLYQQSTALGQGVWADVGVALRLAIDVGAHRRQTLQRPTAENELWKRAFWVLLALDRMLELNRGHPCTVHDEDYDVDFPLECDDEYWDLSNPEMSFKQPPGKPSAVAAFNTFLKLLEISSYASRTIYSIKKATTFPSPLPPKSDQQTIAELDSAMNEWLNDIPEHLRWDPDREDGLFFRQSAFLFTSYYQLQVYVHRPFIPTSRTASTLSFPSLVMCTSASRSCIRIVEVQMRRTKGIYAPLPHMLQSIFNCCVVLLVNSWTGRRSGVSRPWLELAQVKACLELLDNTKTRWESCSHLSWILNEFVAAGVQFDKCVSPLERNGHKRRRDINDHDSGYDTSLSPESDVDIDRIDQATVHQTHIVSGRPIDHSQTNLLSGYQNDTDPFSIYRQSTLYDVPSSDTTFNPAPTSNGLYDPHSTNGIDINFVTGVPVNAFSEQFSGYNNGVFGTVPDNEAETAANLVSLFSELPAMDNDTMNMWSNAPTGFNLDDWGAYLEGVTQMSHVQRNGTEQ